MKKSPISLQLMASTIASSRRQQQRKSPARQTEAVQPQNQERVEENSESSMPTELAHQGEKIEPESAEIKQNVANDEDNVNQQQQHQTSSTTPCTAALSSSSSLAGTNAALEQLFQAAGMMGLNTAATPAMPTPPYHQQQKGAAHQTSSTNSAGPSGIGDGSSNSSLLASSTKSVLTKVESAKTISLPLMASTIASSRRQQQRKSPARHTEAVQPQNQERVEENSESSMPTELAHQREKIEPESAEIKQKVANDED
uniref:Uncharacterized protein n=1 Tax=Globodera rostochiensis TaxID=31243 RepID=A0A914GST3_GLORO